MARLLTHSECEDIWRKDGRGRTGDRLAYYRAVQDRSYRIPENDETFVAHFKNGFPLNPQCQNGKILDFAFKDLLAENLDAEQMYERRVDCLKQKRQGGEYSTLLEGFVRYAMLNHETYLDRLENGERQLLRKFDWIMDEEWTTQDWLTAISLDNQRGSRGVAAEGRVHRELKQAFSGFKHIVYEEAPVSVEQYDIDSYLRGPAGTESISIKNYWALSPSYIARERSVSTKQSPTLYLGYQSDSAQMMTAFNPDGKRVTGAAVLERIGA